MNCDIEEENNVIGDENAADNVADESFEDGDISAQPAEENLIWQDKYIRLSAEFDNYRKRSLKEKMDMIATAGEDVVKAILPVVDDVDRALDAISKSDNIESALTGITLIRQKLLDTLKQKGLCEIEAMDCELDTDLHEAVAKIPCQGKSGKIVDVVQKGYKLKDKVIRFSKVVVGE